MRTTVYISLITLACLIGTQGGCTALLASPAGQAVAKTVVIEGGKKVVKKVGDEFKDNDDQKKDDPSEQKMD